MVTPTKVIRIVEADLVTIEITVFMLGAILGIGLSLGVAGGGMTHCKTETELVNRT